MKNTFKLLTGVIIIYILIKLGCLLIKTIWPGSFTTHLYYLVYLSSFDSMAFGGLAAFFLFKEKKFVTEFLFSKLVQWIVFPVLAISLIIGINLPFFNFEFFSIMFAFLIVNLAANKKSDF
ncbi:MAG: hypothetical protein IPJ81_00425 [Chitinophagaceae bacterium]|nr:hypothetical protein [Chitinophagaceae bacterium]